MTKYLTLPITVLLLALFFCVLLLYICRIFPQFQREVQRRILFLVSVYGFLCARMHREWQNSPVTIPFIGIVLLHLVLLFLIWKKRITG